MFTGPAPGTAGLAGNNSLTSRRTLKSLAGCTSRGLTSCRFLRASNSQANVVSVSGRRYPPEIRKVIYTTNAIESVNFSLRKLTKHRGAFPTDEALMKLLYLALRNISKKWTMPIRDWKAALTRFTIQFEERLPQP